ncbi:hypothetical protein BSR29_05310 [Boudabousia liubingyangii]|uniref:HTH tetR-type domain-containing protein n=1 Tax=Boudabousia liubingyangii TaxID=1921764 RepID=A0A1Q5PLG7_9ACTO|nr:TetR-like C-terminal domain-containing protein [Boudabousia liubingyangii]OKL47904.1 hypothetical protein BSR29_05310 [Boudabousia liubingyangii]
MENTKDRLAEALKEHLKTEPLSRVTVRSLTQEAGVTRQAFYYHFADVIDLAAWVFERDVAGHIMAHATYAEWADGLERLLTYMSTHQEQVEAVISSLPPRRVETFFFEAFRDMMLAIVIELDTQNVARQHPQEVGFVIQHYSVCVAGHVLHWLAAGMGADPRELVSQIKHLMRGQVQASLERIQTGK